MTRNDPELYAKLSTPFETEEAARAALHAFMDEVYEVRKKHGIPDVTIGAMAIVQGATTPAATLGHFGNNLMALPMTAIMFKHYREEHEQRVLAMAGLGDATAPETSQL